MTKTKVRDPKTNRQIEANFTKTVFNSGKPAERVGKKPGPVTYVDRATPPWPKKDKAVP